MNSNSDRRTLPLITLGLEVGFAHKDGLNQVSKTKQYQKSEKNNKGKQNGHFHNI